MTLQDHSSFNKNPPRKPRGEPTNRSRVTNRKRLFLDGEIDQHLSVARRFRDLCQQHTIDAGGAENLSEAQVQLIRRASAIETQLEVLEGRMVAGDTNVDLEEFARVSSHLRRLLETLGIHKVAKDITPSLTEIIARHTDTEAPASKPAPPKPAGKATGAFETINGTIPASRLIFTNGRGPQARRRAPFASGLLQHIRHRGHRGRDPAE